MCTQQGGFKVELFSFAMASAPLTQPPSHTDMHIHSFNCKVEAGMLTSLDF